MEVVMATVPGASRRVFVIEDDADTREMLGQVLEIEGYDVVSAGDGQDALRRLRAEPTPSVILLDLMMPGMNGWQFRDEQRRDPTLAAIPVVVLSGDDGVERKASALGVSGYLRKPIDLGTLLDTLSRYC
jgi:CheY-like chemotaxis protein